MSEKKQRGARELLRDLWPYFREQKWQMMFVSLSAALISGVTVANVHLLRHFLNQLVAGADPAFLWWALAVFGATNVLSGFAIFLQTLWSNSIRQRLELRVKEDVFKKFNSFSLDFYSKKTSGALLNQINNETVSLQTGFNSLTNLVQDTVLLVGMAITAFHLQPVFTLYTLIAIPLVVWPTNQLSKRLYSSAKSMQIDSVRVNHTILENLQGFRIVRIFQGEGRQLARFKEVQQRLFDTYIQFTKNLGAVNAVTSTASLLATGIVLYMGGLAVIGGQMLVGDLIAFMAAIGSMYGPVTRYLRLVSSVQQVSGASENLFETLKTEPTVRDTGTRELIESPEAIQFENVSFRYSEIPGGFRLDNVSLTARRGEILTILGPSGHGKSTILNLLPRFYDPTAGRITVDGVDIRNYRISSWRSNIAMVAQEMFLFNETIFDNISYGRAGATMDEVVAAAKLAFAHDFIQKLPEGYSTNVGERGFMLSEGQKQRIAIARAFLKDAPVLILDEPTSALDVDAEEAVVKALQRLMENRIVLLVTHRLTMLSERSKVVVIEDGRISKTSVMHERVAHLRAPARARAT